MRADFFLSQQPTGEELGIAFVKIGAKENRDREIYGHKCPALPEFQGSWNKQKNHQHDLADQTPADQSQPEAFGWWIFQSVKDATFGDALPAVPQRGILRDAGLLLHIGRGEWRLP